MRSLPGPPAKEAESGGGDGRQLKRRAFTLIELLVVIAILGTLAALLLPALASAKLRARQIQCLSNVKQLTMASATYGSDHGTLAGYDTAPIPHSLWMAKR